MNTGSISLWMSAVCSTAESIAGAANDRKPPLGQRGRWHAAPGMDVVEGLDAVARNSLGSAQAEDHDAAAPQGSFEPRAPDLGGAHAATAFFGSQPKPELGI